MSPDLSPFGLPLDSMEERRRSQALMGMADVEANLSEEKLLQVDMTDGGKVRGENVDVWCCKTSLTVRVTCSAPPPAPPSSPRSLLLHEDTAEQSGLLHLQLPPEEPRLGGGDG